MRTISGFSGAQNDGGLLGSTYITLSQSPLAYSAMAGQSVIRCCSQIKVHKRLRSPRELAQSELRSLELPGSSLVELPGSLPSQGRSAQLPSPCATPQILFARSLLSWNDRSSCRLMVIQYCLTSMLPLLRAPQTLRKLCNLQA